MPEALKIVPILIEDEMKDSYLDYAMSVIVQRALPDVRDGLKPVHRRILYSMRKLGLVPEKAHKKSATIVGDVLGKYHPHGDMAVYDSMVRMAQDFNMRAPLVDGHGNFGSIDGDSAAAYRYTEARLTPLAMSMMQDLEKDTVDYVPNFDNSLTEPAVLPTSTPNLLVNGSAGIAVGMATNIPPHNLGEVVNAAKRLLDNPDTTIEELMEELPAPDFPTGATILGLEGAKSAYLTGRGSITMRGKSTIEPVKNHHQIIITEIPYQVNKTRLLENIAEGVKEKRIGGVTDLRDESDRDGLRIVLDLNASVNPNVVLNQLYKHTPLQTNFGAIMLALVDGVPRVMDLKTILGHYLNHRREVITRRCRFELDEARKKAHILEGLQKAIDHLDAIIKLIRESKNTEAARESLIAQFGFTEVQAKAILDMRLAKLTALERESLKNDLDALRKQIAYLEEVLGSQEKINGLIGDELESAKQAYANPRRTEIQRGSAESFNQDDLIIKQDMVVTFSNAGYIKRIPAKVYNTQKRGGKGIIGATLKEEDFIEHIYETTTHHHLLYFTNKGNVYRNRVYDLPESGRTAKGMAVINLLNLGEGEKVNEILPLEEFTDDRYLFMLTKNGVCKKVQLSAFANLKNSSLRAVNLDEGDELCQVFIVGDDEELIIVSRRGQALKFNSQEVRSMGRTARGMRAMKLKAGDYIVAMARAVKGDELLVVTENGYGKKTPLGKIPPYHRGGMGVKIIKVMANKGEVMGAKVVCENDKLLLSTAQGNVIKLRVDEISTQGRMATGVIVVRLSSGDVLTTMSITTKEEEEEE